MDKSQTSIQALKKAEEQASVLVEKAKQERTSRMKASKAEADEEIEQYSREQEKLLKEMQVSSAEEEAELASLRKKTDIDVATMSTDVKQNKQKVVDLLLEVVAKVDLVIPEARKGIFAQ